MEMRAHAEDNVDIVCRHEDGYWNAVSSDQFGEQTAIRIGNGALKGMTLSADLVSEWIKPFQLHVQFLTNWTVSIQTQSLDVHHRNCIKRK